MDAAGKNDETAVTGRASAPEENAMTSDTRIEKFPVAELTGLRTELLNAGVDSFQAAQMVTIYLSGRGYGVDSALVHEAVLRFEGNACSVECMQQELERVAFVM
jgi:hypothetical protein